MLLAVVATIVSVLTAVQGEYSGDIVQYWSVLYNNLGYLLYL